jgi:hypothetical protein
MTLFSAGTGGAVATFVPSDFKDAFPNFAAVPDPALSALFDTATIYLRNDGTGPCKSTQTQTSLLWLLVAHMAQMSYGVDGKGGSGLVGRVTSASEGSVSVSTEYPVNPGNAWFLQTPHGAAFWQATAAYRMVAGYVPGPNRFGTGRRSTFRRTFR